MRLLIQRFRRWVANHRAIEKVRSLKQLDFEALVKRAEVLQAPPKKTRLSEKPNYLPEPGWPKRMSLAFLGALTFYGGAASIILPFKFEWLSFVWMVAAVPLFCVFVHIARVLANELNMPEESLSGAITRIIFYPFVEPLLFMFGNVFPHCYYVLSLFFDLFESRGDERNGRRLSRTEALKNIPEIVVKIVNEERDRLFGEQSSFWKIRSGIAARLEAARKSRAYFESRVRHTETPTQRISTALSRAVSYCERLEHELKRLGDWHLTICAELDAYCTKVVGISPDIEDLIHLQELNRLEKDMDQLVKDVETEITETTVELLTTISGRCGALNSALREASVRIALTAANTGDCEKDIAIITEAADGLCSLKEPAFKQLLVS